MNSTLSVSTPPVFPILYSLPVLAMACFCPIAAYSATLGSFENPGFSAKHILQTTGNAASGVYWMDPDGPGGNAPFQAYADMATDGGGWTLILNSISGSPVTTTDPVSNTGTVGVATSYSANAIQLARDAQIRHTIVLGSNRFDAYYSGDYYDRLGTSGQWISLSGHNASFLLSGHFGMYWTTEDEDRDQWIGGNAAELIGQPWYYSAIYSTIPISVPSFNNPNGPYAAGQPADSYAIWIREFTIIPEPGTFSLIGLSLACLLLRRVKTTEKEPGSLKAFHQEPH